LPIIFSAGLHDAYSFFCRGGVFANAQTGNIVLMSMNIASGNAAGTVKYIVPLAFFTLGVIVAKVLFLVLGEKKLFWKQAVLLAECDSVVCRRFYAAKHEFIRERDRVVRLRHAGAYLQ